MSDTVLLVAIAVLTPTSLGVPALYSLKLDREHALRQAVRANLERYGL